jgi:DNA repair protein RadC
MTATITGEKMPEIELSYVRKRSIAESIKLNTSKMIYNTFLATWDRNLINLQEQFKILYLDAGNHPLGIYTHSTGGMMHTIVDLKMIIAVALKCCAQHMVIAHNHPSGNTEPSRADLLHTGRIKEGCAYLDIQLLDALVISEEQYFSFADNGLI